MSHRVTELHCIMPLGNVPSVLERGILCHDLADQVEHQSVAMQEIQDVRHTKSVPGGLRLHQYANLYFSARNPMMFKRKNEHASLCVLRVSIDVMAEPGVVLSDQNAASKYARFHPYPDGLRLIDFDYVFADSWQDDDEIEAWRKKSRKCAEALVPNRVDPRFLTAFYVSSYQTKQRLEDLLGLQRCQLPVIANQRLFFR
ncbi:DUF4433 domain-containing protein [Pseudomonas aeruginosa]|uniref:DUF4433 domain-containing protein n=1 Tax=Pseudomonas aeruginosa TaxID=287 RepID=UPI000717B615|nr:DUF4433 domain-containing protein [Pseudomonas aeruginosa]KRV11643.1 hypothetical protein AN458_30310 [Pseudomonas aeruginosa]KSQ89669.1 hypothetical protein APB42_21460 [Pseudomonas aeruginosa]MBG6388708.1 DUF4433 domain-containing protein [Pseudomonas aeruginosa]MDS9612343.1 DUF4433 domain-containing protein [Pseudomonas aeruginosa]PBZ53743.1 DUF4433 domain-containing protein [Pseudomonas aeruginosa]